MVDEQKLRQLAESATPGDWVAKDVPGAGLEIHMDVPLQLGMPPRGWPAFSTQHADIKETLIAYEQWVQFPTEKLANVQARNAVFIAAANPAAILSLLDELQTLREERTVWRVTAENAEAAVKQARIDALDLAMEMCRNMVTPNLASNTAPYSAYEAACVDCETAIESLKGQTP